MSILENSNTPNYTEGLTDKIKTEALNQAQDKLNDLAGEHIQKAQETLANIENKINTIQETASQVQDTFTSLPEDISSKLPPNFYITTPEVSNIRKYSKTLGEGMIVYAKVVLDGKEISKESALTVTITQRMADHDFFEILCPAEAFDENNEYPFQNSKKHLGGKVTIEMVQFGTAAYLFTGIITEISSRRENGYTQVILSGYAPTILLENGEDSQSFEEMDLSSIIKKATEEYQGVESVEFDIVPRCTDTFLYTVEYKESDFNFLKRLAARYGEWFYYNGQTIVFGGMGGKEVEMLEQQDIYEYELKMKAVPQKFTYLSYESKQAAQLSVDSEGVSVDEPVNPFQFSAVKTSEKLFAKVPTALYNQTLLEKNARYELEQAVKRQKEHRMDTVTLEAKSNNPNIRLGDIVKLRAWVPNHEFFATEGLPLESYLITEVTHYHDIDKYYNVFKAVPKDNKVPNYMDENAFPKCEEQSAIVMDNNDPLGLSRIRVKFAWQQGANEMSPWLRVTTPYAGDGKGMHILPEIGEEVMVTFENGNAEKPVVLGAMFNGKGKSGQGGSGNHMKGLQTRSGCHIKFNDKTGHTSLADHGNSNLVFDGNGNSSVSTSNTQIVNVGGGKDENGKPLPPNSLLEMDKDGKIKLKGDESITLEVGNSSVTITEKGIDIKANTGQITISSKSSLSLESIEGTTSYYSNSSMSITSPEVITINGKQVDIN